jgi:hypothetical protein
MSDDTQSAGKTAGKPRGRPFEPGNRANPSGRPMGARNKTTVMLEQMMADDGVAVVQAILDAAKGGDMTAARIIVDRIVPPRKDRPVVVDLPKIESAADIPQATTAILEATAAGNLTPSEGAALVNMVEAHRKALETAELAADVKMLKERAGL